MVHLSKKHKGAFGEDDALEYLKRSGYRFLDRNFRTPWGELDLVVEDKEGTVVFVEVKARFGTSQGSALEQIDRVKILHLRQAINRYVNRFRLEHRSLRLDAVGITYDIDEATGRRRIGEIRHVKDLTGW